MAARRARSRVETVKSDPKMVKCGVGGPQQLRCVKFCACIINSRRVSSIRFLDIPGSFSEYPTESRALKMIHPSPIFSSHLLTASAGWISSHSHSYPQHL